MINNSSIKKWDRLKQKQHNQMFCNKLIEGLNCSQFEAKAIVNLVYEVYQPFFDNSFSMQPGQILFQVVSVENNPGRKLSECSLTSVILTLDEGEDDLVVREAEGVIGLRRHRLQRICNEAFQQGGLLTVEDIANRLLNCGERTICRDISELKKAGIILPLRSIVKDMGRSLSHRSLIIKEWLKGKEYSDVSRITHHSVISVQNYVNKFKRVVCLIKQNYEVKTISFLVKISAKLVEEYYNIYRKNKIVPHRKDELENLIKKNNLNN